MITLSSNKENNGVGWMSNLNRLLVFYYVIESGSFTGAAKQLGIARSAVSRHISLLEEEKKVKLLNRTTRNLGLTEAGKVLFDSCIEIIQQIESADKKIRKLHEQPTGTLKIAAPISLGNQHISPLIREFMALYPELNFDILLDDSVLDMVEQGIDISIRVGWLSDSQFYARKLLSWPRYLCASPEFLQKHGMPETIEDLGQLEWIIFSRLPSPHQWTFYKNNEEFKIQVKGRFKTNNADSVRESLIAGGGLAIMASFVVKEEIKKGSLIRLFPEYEIGEIGMYAVYQHRHFQQEKIKLFLDFLVQHFDSMDLTAG